MLSLNIQNKTVYFRDIKQEHLPQILNWYNKVDDFKFATGIDKAITLDSLAKKYAEVAISSNEFFVGVFLSKEERMVGILKGHLEYENRNTVWISSIVIDTAFQNKGYGQSALDLLLNYLKMNSNIKFAVLAVIEENIQGREFWKKLGFQTVRKIENHIELQDKRQNVIIMSKNI